MDVVHKKLGMEEDLSSLIKAYQKEEEQDLVKYERLRNLDIFVMDNSIRESTVGQLRGHTLESKWELYEEVKKCGFKNTIVASFSHMTRVDDVWIKQLVDRGEDRDGLFAFAEITEGTKLGVPDIERVPVGLRKMKEAGLWHVILEVDLSDVVYDFKKFTIEDMLKLLLKWIEWCHDNLHENSKVFINFRDLPDVMPEHPERVFKTVAYFSRLNKRIRPFGLMFEEPTGKSLPEQCGNWAKYIRKIMDNNNWIAHLLVHTHEKYGYSDATSLQCLMDGCNGIWASVCVEGASMGNASSCVTLTNLVRLGNKKVLDKFNCSYLRKAAINVTKITTGRDPPEKQPIYGGRALDFVYSMQKQEFDLAGFFDENAPVRITTMASPTMICERLKQLFGDEPQFTMKTGAAMKQAILEDLRNNRKEEYMSAPGLAMLFQRGGGTLTESMREAVENAELSKPYMDRIIAEVREIWDTWDLTEEGVDDEMLQFDSFYNAFMAPYFGCYRCSDTKRALQAIDMDADGMVDWNEFLVYLKWALHQFPDIRSAEELLDTAFRKGIIPVMREMFTNQS